MNSVWLRWSSGTLAWNYQRVRRKLIGQNDLCRREWRNTQSMMRVIYCHLQKSWKPSWIVINVAIGCGNHANAPLSRRLWRVSEKMMNLGAWADQARSKGLLPQCSARFGNGAKEKRKWQIARHFTFCKTKSFCMLQSVSLQVTYLITNTFHHAAGRRFGRRPESDWRHRNRSGRYCVGGLELDQLLRRCGAQRSFGGDAINQLTSLG